MRVYRVETDRQRGRHGGFSGPYSYTNVKHALDRPPPQEYRVSMGGKNDLGTMYNVCACASLPELREWFVGNWARFGRGVGGSFWQSGDPGERTFTVAVYDVPRLVGGPWEFGQVVFDFRQASLVERRSITRSGKVGKRIL